MIVAKNKGGRPTLMTEEVVVSKLEIAFAVGANTSEACLVCHYPRKRLRILLAGTSVTSVSK